MSSRIRFHSLLATSAISLVVAALPAAAQELRLDTIVVTPNRAPAKASEIGSSVTVIDEKTIEEQSLPTVSDYLVTVPGVTIASQGGKGSLSTLMVRGLPGEYVKTLINGIDVSDVTYTKVQSHHGQFLAGIMDHMEVLRGSQSTLYGSEAIAGVVDIQTLGGVTVGTHHRIGVEGGSHGTVLGTYRLDAGSDEGQFGLALAGLHTDGFSAAARGTENDGFKNITGTVAGRYEVSPDLTLFASGLIIDSRTRFDDAYPAPDFVVSDSLAYSTYRQIAGRAGAEFTLLDGRLKNTISIQHSRTDRDSISNPAPEYFVTDTFRGGRTLIDYMGSVEVTPDVQVNFGADWQHLTADTSQGIHRSANLVGGWAEAIYSPFDPLTVTLGARYDHHSTFGGHASWRATGSYRFEDTETRLHSSVGTGYRAPSLYELYNGASGNPDLQPETSLSFDAGVEQTLLDGKLVADVTYFQIDVKNYIEWVMTDPNTWRGRYSQERGGRLRSRGVEASLRYAATDWLDLTGSYTYTDARQADGSRQVRVPRNDFRIGATIRPAEKWTISASARIVLDTIDYRNDGSRIRDLDDYVLINAKIAYKPNENTEFYVRAENLLDQHYQVVDGYNTAPLSVFAGIKASF